MTGPIHIARNGTALGRYSEEDVAEGLRDGKFLTTDLAWADPMPAWIPLGEFPGLPEVPEVPPAPLVVPNVESMERPPLPSIEPAWEERQKLGFYKALVESVAAIISRPRLVFASMPATGGYWGPLMFLLITGTVSGWAAIAYQFAITRVNPETLGDALKEVPPEMVNWIFAAIFITMPLGLVISAGMMCGFYHLALMLLSKTPVRFETTFRIYCYAWGAASVFQLLPMCGGYVYPVVAIYLTVLGFRDVQKVNTPVAVLAVLLPMVLCCGLAMMLGFGAVAAGGATSMGK